MPDHYSWFDELTELEQRRINDIAQLVVKSEDRFVHPNARMVMILSSLLDDIYENFSDCVTIEVARQTAGEEPMTFSELLARLNVTEEDLADG